MVFRVAPGMVRLAGHCPLSARCRSVIPHGGRRLRILATARAAAGRGAKYDGQDVYARLSTTAAGARPARSEQRQRQPPRQPPRQLQQLQHQGQPASEYFYAAKAEGFAALGLSPAVCEALRAAGLARPSRAQELAAPHILGGRDLVLAAETGSGKTLAYLAPLATRLLAVLEQLPAQERSQAKHIALVLCPNSALCQQVVSVATSLRGPSGNPLLAAAAVSSASPPPFEPPDLVVATPGSLAGMLRGAGPSYGRLWSPEGLAARVRHVVVDEADLLISGSYVKDLTFILEVMKVEERRRIEAQVAGELGVSVDEFTYLPRPLKLALWEGGAASLLEAGYRRSRRSGAGAGSSARREGGGGGASDGSDASTSSSSSAVASSSDGSDAGSARSGGSEYGPYWWRQYIFVAATMPALTKADVGSDLQRRHKGAVWVSGDLLHRSKPHVAHSWVRVGSEAEWEGALVSAVTSGDDYAAGRGRVLVFARDVASAQRTAGVLAAARVPHVEYHKGVAPEQRAAALATMRGSAGGGGGSGGGGERAARAAPGRSLVMVSTDAAARGIDLPGVGHVVQADFASSAVDFLHRIGRTARADAAGRVTSLYDDASAVLAGAVRHYVEQGLPVEECFSRNRSFSHKVKRYGKFVPRGQSG